MNILVDIGHPADFHFFKNAICKLESDGHKVKITAREKEMTTKLLEAYGFKYHNLGINQKGLGNKAIGMVKTDFKMYRIAKSFNPDILTGVHNPYIAHVSRLMKKQSVIFTDTEHAKLASILTFPFSTAICTPSCFKNKIGKKQIRYNGYHELAYLHPSYFKPDDSILNEIGLQKNDRFIVVRFVSWDASHDVGHHGIQNKIRLVKELEKYGRILITSESKLPVELEPYKILLSPEKIHDLLYYATLYVGEGASMASEAAVLGTPAIYLNPLRLGYTDEEEYKYGLLFNYSDPEKEYGNIVKKIHELFQKSDIKEEWRKKKEYLFNDKIDVTKFVVETIEKYGT